MAKYDVELITDKHGKPMPQYFDEVEKKMKPITKDNFDGTINGSVDVEFPEVQKVEVTNQVDEVSIKELPNMSGTVEVTNLPHIQDVNVTNAIETVSIDNLPSDYPDSAVKTELELIKAQQQQILDKLNDTIDTRLTGSNVKDNIPVELQNRETVQITLIEELSFRGSPGTQTIASAEFKAQPFKDFEIIFQNSLKDADGNGIPVSVGFITNGATEVFTSDGKSVLYSYYTASGRVWNEVPSNGRIYYLSDLPIIGRGTTEDVRLNTPNIWKLFKSNNITPQLTLGFVDRNQEAVEGTLSCWLDGVKN